MISKIQSLLLLLLVIASCSDTDKRTHESTDILIESKTPKLPDNVFWVKSSDQNGLWIIVGNIHNHKNRVTISIYDTKLKEVISSKGYILMCPEKEEIEWIEDLEQQISHYENEIFYFKSSKCYLK